MAQFILYSVWWAHFWIKSIGQMRELATRNQGYGSCCANDANGEYIPIEGWGLGRFPFPPFPFSPLISAYTSFFFLFPFAKPYEWGIQPAHRAAVCQMVVGLPVNQPTISTFCEHSPMLAKLPHSLHNFHSAHYSALRRCFAPNNPPNPPFPLFHSSPSIPSLNSPSISAPAQIPPNPPNSLATNPRAPLNFWERTTKFFNPKFTALFSSPTKQPSSTRKEKAIAIYSGSRPLGPFLPHQSSPFPSFQRNPEVLNRMKIIAHSDLFIHQ